MLLQESSQLLFLLTTLPILPSTAFAQTNSWLFPLLNTQYTFERQDTVAASWTSCFVAPVLTMTCVTTGDPTLSWSISKYHLDAHLSWNLISLFSAMTDKAYYSEFQSPAAVLPNGSYAIPLDTLQVNSGCHLYLKETIERPVTEESDSNSGNFLVNIQCVSFTSALLPVDYLDFASRGII